jgi:hypothetical protein
VSWWTFLAVFVSVAAADLCYAAYSRAVAARRPHAAASWSVVCHCLAYATVFVVVGNGAYLLAVFFGSFVGTELGVRLRS